MVSQVTLGNFFSSGGRTILGGTGGSGLDTQSIIKGLTDAKAFPATQLQDRIKINGERAAVLGEFQTLLSKLKDAANFLRNPPGINNQSSNIFTYTNTSVTSNTAVTGATYVTVATSPGATPQSYTIDSITRLAKSKKQATGSFVIASADTAVVKTAPAAGEFKAGTFTFKGVDITLSDGDTLNNVAAKFNTVSGNTGVVASVIKVDSTHYQLSFVATQSGTANNFDLTNVEVVSLVDPDDVFDLVPTITDTQEVDDAEFSLNGTTIIRSSNNIADVVSGLTFTLFQTTPALTELTVDVKQDTDLIKDGVVNFVNSYNDFRTFVAK
jgi:flagellar hook-associated protein 2